MERLKYFILFLILTIASCSENANQTTEAKVANSKKANPDALLVDKDPELMKAWVHFKNVVLHKDYKEFKSISFDTLKTCYKPYPVTRFTKYCLTDIFDSVFLKVFSDTLYTDYVESEMELDYFPQEILAEAVFTGNSIQIRQFYVTKELTEEGAWTYVFSFIKTKKGYRFFGVDSYGGPVCCS